MILLGVLGLVHNSKMNQDDSSQVQLNVYAGCSH